VAKIVCSKGGVHFSKSQGGGGEFTFVLTKRKYLTYNDVWQYHTIADYRKVIIRNLRLYVIETEGSEHNKMEY